MFAKLSDSLKSLLPNSKNESSRKGRKRQLDRDEVDHEAPKLKKGKSSDSIKEGYQFQSWAEWFVRSKHTLGELFSFNKGSNKQNMADGTNKMAANGSVGPGGLGGGMATGGGGSYPSVSDYKLYDTAAGVGAPLHPQHKAAHHQQAPYNRDASYTGMNMNGQYMYNQPCYTPWNQVRAGGNPQTASLQYRYDMVTSGGQLGGGGHASYQSIYDKTYSNSNHTHLTKLRTQTRSIGTAGNSPTPGSNRLTAKELICMDEKRRYAQLLQQYTSTPVSTLYVRGSTGTTAASSRQSSQIGSHSTASSSALSSSASTPRAAQQPTHTNGCLDAATQQTLDRVQLRLASIKNCATNGLAAASATTTAAGTRIITPTVRSRTTSSRSARSISTSSDVHPSSQQGDNSVIVIDDDQTPQQQRVNRYQQVQQQQSATSNGTTRSATGEGANNSEHDVINRFVSPRFTKVQESEELKKAYKSSPYCSKDWLNDMKEKHVRESKKLEKKLESTAAQVRFHGQKRCEYEDNLVKRIERRLKICAREPAVYPEDFDSEEEDVVDEFPELGDEAEAAVDAALMPRPPHQVLAEGFRLKITRGDMETLKGLNWLNDEVINFYMELLKDRGKQEDRPNVHTFNTFFYPKIMSNGHQGVRRWTKQVDIFAMDYIVVPVHLGMHWCLATVDFRKKQINYYDSMGNKNDPCLKALRCYLQDEHKAKKNSPLDMNDWQLTNVKGIPQQMNGSDCGVFTCKFAEYITRDAEITFTQENMPYFRRRMVYEILTQKLL